MSTQEGLGLLAQVACIWEVTARKPGNVHRFADFDDLSYVEFLLSAAAIAPVMGRARNQRVGQTILDAVQATQSVVRTNTNLGIVLLLAPLASLPGDTIDRPAMMELLDALDLEDSRLVYKAIRLARPGGMGRVENQDLGEEPTLPLRTIMKQAADRDLIARQYATGFQDVLDHGTQFLRTRLEANLPLEACIILCFLELLARHPDSLIQRKAGPAEAEEVSRRAALTLRASSQIDPAGCERAWKELDTWLRVKGTHRNPGTTADLVTACLFVLLREGVLQVPSQRPWNW